MCGACVCVCVLCADKSRVCGDCRAVTNSPIPSKQEHGGNGTKWEWGIGVCGQRTHVGSMQSGPTPAALFSPPRNRPSTYKVPVTVIRYNVMAASSATTKATHTIMQPTTVTRAMPVAIPRPSAPGPSSAHTYRDAVACVLPRLLRLLPPARRPEQRRRGRAHVRTAGRTPRDAHHLRTPGRVLVLCCVGVVLRCVVWGRCVWQHVARGACAFGHTECQGG